MGGKKGEREGNRAGGWFEIRQQLCVNEITRTGLMRSRIEVDVRELAIEHSIASSRSTRSRYDAFNFYTRSRAAFNALAIIR